jgi:hypothetical protein
MFRQFQNLHKFFSIFLMMILMTVVMCATNAEGVELSSHVLDTAPEWFAHDIRVKAKWLPSEINTLGLEATFQTKWNALPLDVRMNLDRLRIPSWQISLIPLGTNQKEEIIKQLRFMVDLAGAAPGSLISMRMEQLLLFGGSAQLPTPGDKVTGKSLGAEGCTAAMAKYVLAQLKIEFPQVLSSLPARLAVSQSSSEMKNIFVSLINSGVPWLRIQRRAFSQLRAEDITPGSLMIAQKPGGTHVFGWTRVPQGWHWDFADKMAIGNTGLAQFGDRMILAQEYVTRDVIPDSTTHNEHGPINSGHVIYRHGQPDLTDPRTNVYAAEGSDFLIITFR